jgi:hypothetical protein
LATTSPDTLVVPVASPPGRATLATVSLERADVGGVTFPSAPCRGDAYRPPEAAAGAFSALSDVLETEED